MAYDGWWFPCFKILKPRLINKVHDAFLPIKISPLTFCAKNTFNSHDIFIAHISYHHALRLMLFSRVHACSPHSLIINRNWLDQIPPHRFEPSAEARAHAAAEGMTWAEDLIPINHEHTTIESGGQACASTQWYHVVDYMTIFISSLWKENHGQVQSQCVQKSSSSKLSSSPPWIMGTSKMTVSFCHFHAHSRPLSPMLSLLPPSTAWVMIPQV